MSGERPQQQPKSQLLEDVLASIISERGGADQFNTLQLIAARGLTRALKQLDSGDARVSPAIATLEAMLPARVADRRGGHVDLGKLDDADLVELERIMAKGAAPGAAEPDDATKQLRALVDENDAMVVALREARRLQRITEQEVEVERRLARDAAAHCGQLRAECAELRDRLDAIAAATGVRAPGSENNSSTDGPAKAAGHPGGRPSNVVPLGVKGSLADRYPSLVNP
jgi:hypothetical protein